MKRSKAAHCQRGDRCLSTAAKHYFRIAVANMAECIAHSIRAGSACRYRAGTHAVEAIADCNVARRHIGNGHRNKIRRNAVVTLLRTFQTFCLCGGKSADAAGKKDGTAGGIFVFHTKAALLHCFVGGRQRKLRITVQLAHLALINRRRGVKVFHLARQGHFLLACIILRNRANAALVGAHSAPALLQVQAQRRHCAHAGDDNPSFLHLVFLPFFTSPCRRRRTAPAR